MLGPNDSLVARRRGSLGIEVLRIATPLLVLAAGLVGFLILSNLRGAPVIQSDDPQPPLVETVTVEGFDQGVDIEVDGLVVPYREVNIAAEVSGRIKHKPEICRAGNYVTKGTLLIEIEPIDYQLEVRRLSKELEQAKVTIGELDVETADTQELIKLAEEEVKLHGRELQRMRSLSPDRFVTDSKVDEAMRAELTARNALVRLRSQLRLLQTRRNRLLHGQELVATQLEKAQLDLQRTKISAPMDGVIVKEAVEQDSYVQPGDSLLSLEDTSSVEVRCNLRMKDLNWVLRQSPSSASPAAEPLAGYQIPATPASVVYALGGREFAWDGMLRRYDGIGLDEQTRTVPCRVVVDNPRQVHVRGTGGAPTDVAGPPALVRGMYVTVFIHTRPHAALLKIPERAVQPGNVVWLVEGGKLRRREIQVAHLLEDGVLVEAGPSGFAAGTRIIVSALASPYDGMNVREKPSS
jgi:RND family efflux transporter MFP subunit